MCLHPSRLEYGIVLRDCPQKIPLIPLRERAGQFVAQKSTGIAPVLLSFARERYGFKTGFLARFPARSLCLPGLSQWRLSKSRSPYSCGTAQASHLFPRHEAFILRHKKQADTPPTFIHKFFIYYKRMKFILQYKYPYRYLHKKSESNFHVSFAALRKLHLLPGRNKNEYEINIFVLMK